MPAGVAVMRACYGKRDYSKSLLAGLLLAEGALVEDADVAEDLVEEAAVAAERRSLVVDRVDLRHQSLVGAVDRNHVAGGIEANMDHVLVQDLLAAEGDRLGIARHIIPIVGIELAGEGRTAKRLGHRILVVDADLDGRSQFLVEHIAAVLLRPDATAEQGDARHRQAQADHPRHHETETPLNAANLLCGGAASICGATVDTQVTSRLLKGC